MFTSRRVEVDAWVVVKGRFPVSCDVIGDSAQFEFGTDNGKLNLVADEVGLDKLVTVATAALTGLRAVPAGEPVEFVVADPDAGRAR